MAQLEITVDRVLGMAREQDQSDSVPWGLLPLAVWTDQVDADGNPTYLTGVGGTTLTLAASAAHPVFCSFADGITANGPKVKASTILTNKSVNVAAANAEYYAALQFASGLVTLVLMPRNMLVKGFYPSTFTAYNGASVTVGHPLNASHFANASLTGTASTSGTALAPTYLYYSLYGEPYMPAGRFYNYVVLAPAAGVWDYIYDFGAGVTKTVKAVALGTPMYKSSSSPYNCSAQTSAYPGAFQIQGSANGIAWTTLATFTGQTCPANWASKVYPITTPAAYRYYRVYVTTVPNGAHCYFGPIDFFGESGTLATDEFSIRDNMMVDNAGADVYRVYVGRVRTDAAGNISTITPWRIGLRYESALTTIAAQADTTFSHNLGIEPQRVVVYMAGTADQVMRPVFTSGSPATNLSYGALVARVNPTELVVQSGRYGVWVGAGATTEYLTAGRAKVIAERGW